MSSRTKKLIALFILVPGLGAYLLLAAAIGERTPDVQIVKIAYYIVAGLAWAWPVRKLIVWAEKGQEELPK